MTVIELSHKKIETVFFLSISFLSCYLDLLDPLSLFKDDYLNLLDLDLTELKTR